MGSQMLNHPGLWNQSKKSTSLPESLWGPQVLPIQDFWTVRNSKAFAGPFSLLPLTGCSKERQCGLWGDTFKFRSWLLLNTFPAYTSASPSMNWKDQHLLHRGTVRLNTKEEN